MSGWYIMRRGWMDGFRPEPFTDREAFLWSIEQAAWEDHDQWFNGHPIAVSRGEFVTSLRVMEGAFQWSIKRVRGFMERMSKAEKWAHRSAGNGAQSPTIISVLNYSKYQQFPTRPGTAEGTAEGTPRAQQGHSRGTQQNLRKPQETAIERSVGAAGAAAAAYAFAGKTVRLTVDDFAAWRKTYHAIPDLAAELMAIDGWFQTEAGAAKRKNWFPATSGMLNRKHQELLGQKKTNRAIHIPGGGTPLASPC